MGHTANPGELSFGILSCVNRNLLDSRREVVLSFQIIKYLLVAYGLQRHQLAEFV